MNFKSSFEKHIYENPKNTKRGKKGRECALKQYENTCKAALIKTALEISKEIEKQINAQYTSTELFLSICRNFKIIKCVTLNH